MSKACPFCGTEVSDTAKFCRSCGKDIVAFTEIRRNVEKIPVGRLCTNCGTSLSPTAKFCRNCGNQVSESDASLQREDTSSDRNYGNQISQADALLQPEDTSSEKEIKEVVRQVAGTIMASSSPGDCVLGVNTPSAIPADTAGQISATVSVLGPLKVLGNGLITAIKGLKEAGKNKKALGWAIVMAVIWFTLTMFSAMGTSVPAWLNFLTFAKGGTTGGIPGFVGGVLGKGLFVSLIMGMIHNIGRPKATKNLSDSTEKAQSSHGYGLILCGMGLALIIYNFMTGDNSLQNSMAGIIAAASVVRSSKQGGFIRQLMVSLTARFSGKKLPLDGQVKHLTTGFAAGFGLSLPLSFSGNLWVCYLTGLAVFIIGIILCSTVRKQKDISAV
ncbi:MAG: zinc ribbon domain-containing protein [Dehalococcoidales bacterium]